MRVLTDNRVLAASFVPNARPDAWHDDAGRSALEAALIAALERGSLWTQSVDVPNAFCWTVVILSRTDVSQFDTLSRVMGSGHALPGPIASVAATGSRFHGQRGRAWTAAAGNLHMSLAVPSSVAMSQVGVGLSMLPAVSAIDAIARASHGRIQPQIKWVNDLVIGDGKVGGVLATAHSKNGRIDGVVWGIGINIEVAPDIAPTPIVPGTTCLHAHPGGECVTVSRLFWVLLDSIAARYADLVRLGPSALFSVYERHSAVVGRAVQVWDETACVEADVRRWGPPLVEGIVSGIDADLSLRLQQGDLVTRGRLALRS